MVNNIYSLNESFRLYGLLGFSYLHYIIIVINYCCPFMKTKYLIKFIFDYPYYINHENLKIIFQTFLIWINISA